MPAFLLSAYIKQIMWHDLLGVEHVQWMSTLLWIGCIRCKFCDLDSKGKQSQVHKGSSHSCFPLRLRMYWAQDAISSPRSPWHSPWHSLWHSLSGCSRPSLDLSRVAASSLDVPQWSGNKGQRKARAKRQRSQSRTWAKIIDRASLLSKTISTCSIDSWLTHCESTPW